LAFGAEGASALVTPGANSVWVTASNEYAGWIPDDDKDGVVLWPWDYPYRDVWAVVDVASGKWDVRATLSAVAISGFPAHSFVRDAAGAISQFALRLPEAPLTPGGKTAWRLMWVRPGVGAWTKSVTDGDDADGVTNGIAFGSITQVVPIGSAGAAKSPAGFEAGDVVILMHRGVAQDATPVMVATLDDELIDGAKGVLQFAGARFGSEVSFSEKSGKGATLNVMRTDGGEGTVTVNYATTPVSPYAQQSYVQTAGTLTFAPGETLKTIVVPLVQDNLYIQGIFDVVLSSPGGATLGARTTMRVHINDDDTPAVTAAGPNPRVVRETDAPQTVEVQLVITGKVGSISAPWTLKKNFSTVVEASGTAVFGEGQSSAVISFPLPGNTVYEGDREYRLTWSTPGTSDGALPIILQDDDEPVVTAQNVFVLEDQQTARVTLSLHKALSSEVHVDYTTANGTATSPDDYAATTGFVVFAVGEMHRDVAIALTNDKAQEEDETFNIDFVTRSNSHSKLRVSVTVVDDDGAAPVPRATIAGTTAVESSGVAQFEVRLSTASTEVVKIFYSTSDRTATAGIDYQQATESELRFAPGELIKTIAVPILTDALDEADETFAVTLIRGTNAGISTEREATATIIDDDAAAAKPPSRRRSVRH
ncbi:MAG TPA: Calx-beta domain-containing protein, partial [Thermoanaerobaculia bacterium]